METDPLLNRVILKKTQIDILGTSRIGNSPKYIMSLEPFDNNMLFEFPEINDEVELKLIESF